MCYRGGTAGYQRGEHPTCKSSKLKGCVGHTLARSALLDRNELAAPHVIVCMCMPRHSFINLNKFVTTSFMWGYSTRYTSMEEAVRGAIMARNVYTVSARHTEIVS